MMASGQRSRGVARCISVGHLLVGGAALVFAGVMIVAGSDSRAELGRVLLPLGSLLSLAAAVFTYAAGVVLQSAPRDRRGTSLILSIIELFVGGGLAAGVIVAVDSYGKPWRSPLLLPSVLLVALGIAGLTLEIFQRARSPESTEPPR